MNKEAFDMTPVSATVKGNEDAQSQFLQSPLRNGKGRGDFMIHLHLKASKIRPRSQTYKYDSIVESLIIYKVKFSYLLYFI